MIKKILNILLSLGVLYVVGASFVNHDKFHSLIFHFGTSATETAASASGVRAPQTDTLPARENTVAVEGADSLAKADTTVLPTTKPDTAKVAAMPHSGQDSVR